MSKDEATLAESLLRAQAEMNGVTADRTTIGPRKLSYVEGGRVANLLMELDKGGELARLSIPAAAALASKSLAMDVPVSAVRTIVAELKLTTAGAGERTGAVAVAAQVDNMRAGLLSEVRAIVRGHQEETDHMSQTIGSLIQRLDSVERITQLVHNIDVRLKHIEDTAVLPVAQPTGKPGKAAGRK